MNGKGSLKAACILMGAVFLAAGCGSSGTSCPVGQKPCNGVCVDTTSDRNNCGGCGNTCLSGQECSGSQCVPCNNECTQGSKRCVAGTTDQFQSCGDPDGDTCLEWGPPQTCPTGQICQNGSCVVSCTDECFEVGTQACDKDGANGWRTCGDYDADDCLDWGPLNACPTGQVCQNGSCVSSCTNTCTPANDTRCATTPRNGVETCGDYNQDGCLEWGGYYACPTGETCDTRTKQCSPDCSDDCTTGQRMCDGNGYRTCGQHDGDVCLDWSDVTNCQSWETCDPQTGTCKTACADACTQGQRRCNGTIVELCANWNADPCLEYGTLETCGTGYKCENGACVEDCQNECTTQGARECRTDGQGKPGYVVCGNWDQDSCLEWNTITLCQSGESCSAGQCSATCTDECAVGQKECVGNSGWRACGEAGDGDSCRDWLSVTACQSWEVCDPNTVTCVTNCTDACGPANSRRCTSDNTGYETCGNWDQDPCLEWSGPTSCGTGRVCEPATGQCRDDCSDECPTGGRQCLDDDTYQLCGNWDQDSCLEWGGNTDCQSGYICSSGNCAADCQNECSEAQTTFCDGTGGWRLCGYLDQDPCLDAGSYNACAYNEECQNGACVVICTNECTPGQTRCDAGGTAVEICATDGDADPCTEWKTQVACVSGSEVCHQSVCVSTTAPAKLVVSKLLYDNDGTPDTAYSYIEIFGPADLQLNHYSLVGINGNGGTVYVTIDLSGYTMPADGHFAVAHTNTQWDTGLIDMLSSGADLQNGPDAVQVRWAGETVVDALGYEEGAIGAEGDPAESADYDSTDDIMYCLGRRYDNSSGTYLDTDDNYVDFDKRTYCTPGDAGYGLRLAEYNTYSSGVGATPAVDPNTWAVFIPSFDYFDEVLGDFTGYAWWDVIIGDKGSPALSPDGGAVYVGIAAGAGAADSGLRAYQTLAGGNTTGAAVRLWHVLAGTEVKSSPAVDSSGNIYVGTRGGGFLSLYSSNGGTRWSWPEANWIDSSPALGPIGSGGTTLVVFGVGGVGSGKIVALDASTGALAWQVTTPTGGCNGSPGLGSDGTVYIGCDDGYLYAVDGAAGTVKTGFPVVISANSGGTREQVKGRSVAVASAAGGGDVIFATSAGSAVNFNVVNSAGQKNSYNFGEALSSVTITRDGGFVFLIGDPAAPGMFVLAYSPYWTLEWYDYLGDYDAAAWITSSPNAIHVQDGYGLVYAGTTDGKVYVYYWAAGLYNGAGSFPKFRGLEDNSGKGF